LEVKNSLDAKEKSESEARIKLNSLCNLGGSYNEIMQEAL